MKEHPQSVSAYNANPDGTFVKIVLAHESDPALTITLAKFSVVTTVFTFAVPIASSLKHEGPQYASLFAPLEKSR